MLWQVLAPDILLEICCSCWNIFLQCVKCSAIIFTLKLFVLFKNKILSKCQILKKNLATRWWPSQSLLWDQHATFFWSESKAFYTGLGIVLEIGIVFLLSKPEINNCWGRCYCYLRWTQKPMSQDTLTVTYLIKLLNEIDRKQTKVLLFLCGSIDFQLKERIKAKQSNYSMIHVIRVSVMAHTNCTEPGQGPGCPCAVCTVNSIILFGFYFSYINNQLFQCSFRLLDVVARAKLFNLKHINQGGIIWSSNPLCKLIF